MSTSPWSSSWESRIRSGRGLHQSLQAGIPAVPRRLAQGDDGVEPGAGRRLAGGLGWRRRAAARSTPA